MEEGDYQGAIEAFDRALEVAHLARDPQPEVRALVQSSIVDYWHLRWEETIQKGLQVINHTGRQADWSAEVSARFWIGVAHLCSGNLKEVQKHAPVLLSTAESARDRYLLTTALWLNKLIAFPRRKLADR